MSCKKKTCKYFKNCLVKRENDGTGCSEQGIASTMVDSIIESAEYARFIMPTAAELAEERRIAVMSKTERELYELWTQMLDGKIPRLSEHISGRTCYEDAIGCTLFWAVEYGEITQEESDRLYSQYVG